jgi:hypothetical protein
MPNPIFQNQKPSRNPSIFGLIQQLRNGDPQALFNQMYLTNPEFRTFAESMRGKTPEQAFLENGLDYNQFKGML